MYLKTNHQHNENISYPSNRHH